MACSDRSITLLRRAGPACRVFPRQRQEKDAIERAFLVSMQPNPQEHQSPTPGIQNVIPSDTIQEFPHRHAPRIPPPSCPRNSPTVMPRAFPTRHAPRIPPPSFPGISPLSFPPVVSGNPEKRAMNPIDLAPRLTVAVMAPSCDDEADTRHFVLVPGMPHPSFPGIPPLSFPPVVSGNPEKRAMNPIDLAPRIPVAAMAPSCDDETDTRRFVLAPGMPPRHSPGILPPVIPQAFPHLSFPPVVSGNPERKAKNPIDLAPRLTYAVMAPSCDDEADTRRFVLVNEVQGVEPLTGDDDPTGKEAGKKAVKILGVHGSPIRPGRGKQRKG